MHVGHNHSPILFLFVAAQRETAVQNSEAAVESAKQVHLEYQAARTENADLRAAWQKSQKELAAANLELGQLRAGAGDRAEGTYYCEKEGACY